MIKRGFITAFCLVFFSLAAMAQVHKTSAEPQKDFENIHVKKISSDEHSSTFIIWVKKNVKAHKHVSHSETLYVLAGAGDMKIGEKTYSIEKGDLFNIPENTVHSVTVTSEQALKVISVQAPEFKGEDRVFIE